jgi:ferredoxin
MSETPVFLKVNFDRCSKAGECYYNHPDLFMMTESGFPALRTRHPATPAEIREAREAAAVCPTGAISFEG